MSTDLGRYLPRIYDGIYETDLIMAAENSEFDGLKMAIEKVRRNQYILTADMDGITDFERIYKITANPETEDLEFRRQRVLARASLTLPFTVRFLRQKLDEIIGTGKYLMSIDYSARELRIESSMVNANWYHELNVLIGKIKPCNMVYINNPFAEYTVKTSEQIGATEIIYNYRLGTSWLLGQKPFGSVEEIGVIKMPEVPSVTNEMLADIASFAADDINNVLINNSLQISEFEMKEAEGNTAVITYSIPDDAVTEITNIKLRKDTTVLCESSVYVPVTSQVVINHRIAVKEGV